MITLQGVLHPQVSSAPPVYWANAGFRMLVRIGAVQAMAAPAPIRFIIFLLEMPSFGSSSSGLIDSPPPPQVQELLTFRARESPNGHWAASCPRGNFSRGRGLRDRTDPTVSNRPAVRHCGQDRSSPDSRSNRLGQGISTRNQQRVGSP